MQSLCHPFPPLWDKNSKILILGSFPSQKSREVSFFYGHPQNRFWRLLPRLWDHPPLDTVEDRAQFAHTHHIALWDVIESCRIQGSSDASIRDVKVNDFTDILANSQIGAVFCNGALATKLYAKHCADKYEVPFFTLPSTSPANAAYSMDRLLSHWSIIKNIVEEISKNDRTNQKNN